MLWLLAIVLAACVWVRVPRRSADPVAGEFPVPSPASPTLYSIAGGRALGRVGRRLVGSPLLANPSISGAVNSGVLSGQRRGTRPQGPLRFLSPPPALP